MKIFRMLIFGLIGIIASAIGFFCMSYLSNIIYGLIVSLLGSLAGAHAVLGYIGKDKPKNSDLKKILAIGVIYGILGAALPYLFFGMIRDLVDILFIGIAGLGGYEAAKKLFLFRYYSDREKESDAKAPMKKELAEADQKLRKLVITKRLVKFAISQIYIIALILLVSFLFFPSVGVAWILIIPIAAYELWRRKIFQVSPEDLDKARPSAGKSIWKTDISKL